MQTESESNVDCTTLKMEVGGSTQIKQIRAHSFGVACRGLQTGHVSGDIVDWAAALTRRMPVQSGGTTSQVDP